MYTMTCT